MGHEPSSPCNRIKIKATIKAGNVPRGPEKKCKKTGASSAPTSFPSRLTTQPMCSLEMASVLVCVQRLMLATSSDGWPFGLRFRLGFVRRCAWLAT